MTIKEIVIQVYLTNTSKVRLSFFKLQIEKSLK